VLLTGLLILWILNGPWEPYTPVVIFASSLGLSAMGVQSAFVRLLIQGSPSTDVTTTNTTHFAIDTTELVIAWLRRQHEEIERRLTKLLAVLLSFFLGTLAGAAAYVWLDLWCVPLPIGIIGVLGVGAALSAEAADKVVKDTDGDCESKLLMTRQFVSPPRRAEGRAPASARRFFCRSFNPTTARQLKFYMPSIKATASSVAVEVSDAPVHAKEEIEGIIAAQARTPGGGIIAMPDPFTNTNREVIMALAARYRVPTISTDPLYAELGGLISYGADFAELFRQEAEYIDRALKGANPGELPIQQPTKYELVINLKTGKALGLTIPESVLSLADRVIE
jgi:ABC transporter substrate binding protein/Protein of unknown function (DUF1275)